MRMKLEGRKYIRWKAEKCQQENSPKRLKMPLTTTKKNRNDIKEIAKHSKELFDYMLHICNILADPPKYKLHEREMQGFKKDLALTLKKIDENNGLILGHLAYEDIKHEAFSTTFKILACRKRFVRGNIPHKSCFGRGEAPPKGCFVGDVLPHGPFSAGQGLESGRKVRPECHQGVIMSNFGKTWPELQGRSQRWSRRRTQGQEHDLATGL